MSPALLVQQQALPLAAPEAGDPPTSWTSKLNLERAPCIDVIIAGRAPRPSPPSAVANKRRDAELRDRSIIPGAVLVLALCPLLPVPHPTAAAPPKKSRPPNPGPGFHPSPQWSVVCGLWPPAVQCHRCASGQDETEKSNPPCSLAPLPPCPLAPRRSVITYLYVLGSRKVPALLISVALVLSGFSTGSESEPNLLETGNWRAVDSVEGRFIQLGGSIGRGPGTLVRLLQLDDRRSGRDLSQSQSWPPSVLVNCAEVAL
jgi:hypothetical protein